MTTVQVARQAMATRFEVLLHGADEVRLRAAAEEALDEIERLETQLSLFQPTSEISHVNRHAAEQPVRVTPPVFRLLQRAQELSTQTQGAFDVTVAPLVRCWGFMGGSGQPADPDVLAQARDLVGMHGVELDETDYTVRFTRPGVMLDLGAIGKGYALDCAVEVLREAGVSSALFHGGTSSVYALGAPPDAGQWRTALPKPHLAAARALTTGPESLLATIALTDESLGVSAVWGKCFRQGGQTLGHVIDPRTGQPVQRALLAAVVLPSATETDAFSTALLTLGAEGLEVLEKVRPEFRGLVVAPSSEPPGYQVLSRNLPVLDPGA